MVLSAATMKIRRALCLISHIYTVPILGKLEYSMDSSRQYNYHDGDPTVCSARGCGVAEGTHKGKT